MDTDINTPLVSAIMTVYNGEKFLAEAIDSVLAQTYKHFELLILNDGSRDATEKIILEKQKSDSRIKYYKNEKNAGLSKTKNQIIPLTAGPYVAIVDGDDINAPDRFEKQVAALNNNSNVQIVGSSMRLINGRGEACDSWEYSTADADIKKGLTVSTTMANPSAMFRREVFFKLEGYDENLSICEDWEFFYRAARYFNFMNLPECLVSYRIHDSNTSVNKLEYTVLFAVCFKNNLSGACFNLDLKGLVNAYPECKKDVCVNITKFYSHAMHTFLKLKYPHLSYGLYRTVKDKFFIFYDRPAKKLFIKSAVAVHVRNGYFGKVLPLLIDYIFVK